MTPYQRACILVLVTGYILRQKILDPKVEIAGGSRTNGKMAAPASNGPGPVIPTNRWRNRGLFGLKMSPEGRSDRFPSTEERIEFYMGSWYIPPNCQHRPAYALYNKASESIFFVQSNLNKTMKLSSDSSLGVLASSEAIEVDEIGVPTADSLNRCIHNSSLLSLKEAYCPDLLTSVLPIYSDLTGKQNDDHAPLLVQVGDGARSRTALDAKKKFVKASFPAIPHIKKFRHAWGEWHWNERPHLRWESFCHAAHTRWPIVTHEQRLQPLVWKLGIIRHYKGLEDTYRLDSTPWEQKKNKSVFRGALTGKVNTTIKDDYERCMSIPRCRAVQLYSNSKVVDASLTQIPPNTVPRSLHGIEMLGDRMAKSELLQYKCIIVLQGNDVSTGLKWALLSMSVVLMPRPTYSSWMMEEWLEPYVHYVPIRDDLADMEDQTKWVLRNEREARQISRRATLWMEDLIFHPDSQKDNNFINSEIISRYNTLFQHMDSETASSLLVAST